MPRHTCLHSKGTPRVPSQLRKSFSFPSSSREEGSFTYFFRKRIPAFLSHHKRSRSHLDTREELQGSCHHFKGPRCPNALQIHMIPWTDSTVTLRINSQHDGRYDSPVTPGEKATDPYVNTTGSLKLLFQLEKRADLHVSTRDED